MVFVHHRDSLTHLADRLRRQGTPLVLFEGGMSGPEKDAAVEAFRDQVPLLLCSESGGEGRNLQFCNTLINFDIPWNPMAIEQRIGRIDRIGQTREVYVFNLATAGTIEDTVLRILDEKINMFELVVGEVGAILGEFEEQQDFSSLVLDAWLQETDAGRTAAFTQLENQLLAARRQYEDVKALDEALFGNAARCRLRWAACRASSPRCWRGTARWSMRSSRRGWRCWRRRTIQQALALPELCRLGFGVTLPSGARRVGIETEWLDRFDRLLGDRGRWARLVLRPEVRAPSDPERVLGHELVLDNATFRLLGVAPAWTRYLVLDFPLRGGFGREARGRAAARR